jgi:hypothetical protein
LELAINVRIKRQITMLKIIPERIKEWCQPFMTARRHPKTMKLDKVILW